jgi:ABC-type amino acid transport substrate-binding protein
VIRGALLAASAVLVAGVLALTVWWGRLPRPDPAWERIQRTGVLRVGTDATYPPFESIANGQYVGYDMGLARALAAGLGVRAEFVNLSLDGQYDALAQDKVDVLISALPFIYERQKEVRYTRPYYDDGPVLVLPAGSAIAQPPDLAGHTVAVELGTDADMVARRLQRGGVALRLQSEYHSTEAALDALATGQADAAISDPITLAAWTHTKGGATAIGLQTVPIPVAAQPLVIAMRVPAYRLGPALDDLLVALQADGRLARLMGETSDER